ncbi:hypothetical protein ACFLUP_01540 [Chloroflexota bacterium]
MVKDTGKTLHTDTYRSVNLPESVEVSEDDSGLPLAIKIPKRQEITAVDDRWRIDDEWWRRETVSRIYYSVRLVSGHRLVLYKDLLNNCWYRQSY